MVTGWNIDRKVFNWLDAANAVIIKMIPSDTHCPRAKNKNIKTTLTETSQMVIFQGACR
jgi:hypothetical protein